MRAAPAQELALLGISILQGGYMLFDGLHKLVTGTYFGSHPGPWADLVAALGVSPSAMAPVFIFLGALWLAGAGALLRGLGWSRSLLTVLSIVSLAYLVFGSLLSVVALVLLLSGSLRSIRRSRSSFPT